MGTLVLIAVVVVGVGVVCVFLPVAPIHVWISSVLVCVSGSGSHSVVVVDVTSEEIQGGTLVFTEIVACCVLNFFIEALHEMLDPVGSTVDNSTAGRFDDYEVLKCEQGLVL